MKPGRARLSGSGVAQRGVRALLAGGDRARLRGTGRGREASLRSRSGRFHSENILDVARL